MNGKFGFIITMTVALSASPQIAHASCSGNACTSFKVLNKIYSTSDKRFRATLANTDPSKKIRLKGCMGSTKSPTEWCWDVTIDRGKTASVENGVGIIDKPEVAAQHLTDFVVEITSAEFLEEAAAPKPPAKPAVLKVSVVNGEPEPLLITIRDTNDNSVVADRTLWNASPYEVTLTSKAGKGRLNWAVSTMKNKSSESHSSKPKPGEKSLRCGEGSVDNLTAGAKVVLKASHGC